MSFQILRSALFMIASASIPTTSPTLTRAAPNHPPVAQLLVLILVASTGTQLQPRAAVPAVRVFATSSRIFLAARQRNRSRRGHSLNVAQTLRCHWPYRL